MKYAYEFPRPSVTVDCVVFGFNPSYTVEPLQILLVRRKEEPFKDHWALPGGFVNVSDEVNDQGEPLEDAAKRKLKEEANINLTYIEQLYTFGYPDRDPRGRVISVAYFALVRAEDYVLSSGKNTSAADWIGVDTAQTRIKLAFDHRRILIKAIERLRMKIRYEPIGFNLLPPKFTLSELRNLYEGVTGRKLDASNFRKRILATKVLFATGKKQTGQHRPAPYYVFNKNAYQRAIKKGFSFEI